LNFDQNLTPDKTTLFESYFAGVSMCFSAVIPKRNVIFASTTVVTIAAGFLSSSHVCETHLICHFELEEPQKSDRHSTQQPPAYLPTHQPFLELHFILKHAEICRWKPAPPQRYIEQAAPRSTGGGNVCLQNQPVTTGARAVETRSGGTRRHALFTPRQASPLQGLQKV